MDERLLQKNIREVIKILKKRYYKKNSFKDPFHVLISTILSQRTKDETTYSSSKRLFSKLKNINDFEKASVKEIEKLIYPVGFYKTKAKRIKKVVKILKEKFNGKVPKNEKDLISLPGVGKKTAACVLVYGYGMSKIPADVHVTRISQRLGWVKKGLSPEKTQEVLEKIVPNNLKKVLNSILVEFGKDICGARPKCNVCPIRKYCRK